MKKIALIDYGSGNLRSVSKALEKAGAEVTLTSSTAAMDSAHAIVVPGVGSFGDCAKNLRDCGLWQPIRDWLQAGRPYFGICLGYQLLFESSEESPGVEGLGVFKGTVRRFPESELKVPHMGWNTLKDTREPLFTGLMDDPFFYFVHSFFPVPDDQEIVSSRCAYGDSFASSISTGAIHATQFHPEKSQANGLALLRNFLNTLE